MLQWKADQIGEVAPVGDTVIAEKSTTSLKTDASSSLLDSEHAEFYIWRVQIKNYVSHWY